MAEASTSALDEAEAALASGRPDSCLAALLRGGPAAALPPQPRTPAQRRRAQLHAVCRVQLAAQQGSWWELLGLNPADASAADVKRQAKRLGAWLHPDRNPLPPASEAFQQLQRGAEALADSLADAGDFAGGSAGHKRARSSAGSDARASAGDADVDDAGVDPEGGGFPWWGRWDPPSAAADAYRGLRAQQMLDPGGAAQAEQDQAADAARLRALAAGALAAEVRRRQDALLAPAPVEGAAPPSLPALRAALLRARSELSGRAQRARGAGSEGGAAGGGGFLP